ncbi:hypothetical protein RJ640_009136 [Escallonia rubra]|uniref:Uncharacterized protein n=1 Tax=Escallonia rubra TaxID=112253 RepID=A0AA88QS18_9ASTE|nr:hypothetical protein RJ640_009136 [Escallonia rubra]
MSIALESSAGDRIGRLPGGMSCIGIYESAETGRFAGDRRLPLDPEVGEGDTCSSSSIGRDSDSSDGGGVGDEDGESLFTMCVREERAARKPQLTAIFSGASPVCPTLESVLCYLCLIHSRLSVNELLGLFFRRGISTFYCGKSKSFTSLADAASCSSIKDIAKPEDAYTRKRKNLLAHSYFFDKASDHPPRSGGGGLMKKHAKSSRSTFALSSTTSSSESLNNSESSNSASNSNTSSPSHRLPPRPPNSRRSPENESSLSPPRRNYSPWRSFSLSDLQHAAAAAAAPPPSVNGLAMNNGHKEK